MSCELDQVLVREHLPERAIERDRGALPPRCEHPRVRLRARVECAQAGELLPGGLGGHGRGRERIGQDLLGLLAHPPEPRGPDLGGEQRVERVEVADIRRRVRELGLGQRPAVPGGPLLVLAQVRTQQLVGEGREAELITEPGERGHQLRIAETRHRGESTARGQQREILARGVGDDEGVSRERHDDRADVRVHRVDQPHRGKDFGDRSWVRSIELPMLLLVHPRDLEQAQHRGQAVGRGELEIERRDRCSRDRLGDPRNLGRFGDQIHSQHLRSC